MDDHLDLLFSQSRRLVIRDNVKMDHDRCSNPVHFYLKEKQNQR